MKASNSIENLHNLSVTNRIENYECFQLVGFEILTKSAKMKKKCSKMTTGKAVKMKIGLKMRLKWPYLSQKFRLAQKLSTS